jgi:molecular chaperone GrpE
MTKEKEDQETREEEQAVEREPIPVQVTDLELENLRREASEFKNKYFRLLAEQENTRKRLMKERDDLSRHSARNVIADFLAPIDQMENALRHAKNMSEEIKHWAVGFEMILGQFKDILDSNGVKPMDCVGQQFDPHLHHVTETIESNEHPPGTIVEETLKGYVCGEQTLRPAHVIVVRDHKENNLKESCPEEDQDETNVKE